MASGSYGLNIPISIAGTTSLPISIDSALTTNIGSGSVGSSGAQSDPYQPATAAQGNANTPTSSGVASSTGLAGLASSLGLSTSTLELGAVAVVVLLVLVSMMGSGSSSSGGGHK